MLCWFHMKNKNLDGFFAQISAVAICTSEWPLLDNKTTIFPAWQAVVQLSKFHFYHGTELFMGGLNALGLQKYSYDTNFCHFLGEKNKKPCGFLLYIQDCLCETSWTLLLRSYNYSFHSSGVFTRNICQFFELNTF